MTISAEEWSAWDAKFGGTCTRDAAVHDQSDSGPRKGKHVHVHLHGLRDQAAMGNTVTPMGSNPGGGVGGELIARLPGKGTDYFISALDDNVNNCGLYRHSSAEDPGVEGQDPVPSLARRSQDAAMRAVGVTPQMPAMRKRDAAQRD